MIGKAIYALIIDTDNGVGDTIGTRCYPMTAPQGAEYPCVTYEPSPPQPSDTKHGPSTLDVQPTEVVIYSRKFSEAEDIASTLRAMFDRYSGTVATVPIQSVQFQNQSYEHYPEIELYAIVQQYQFRLPRDLSVVITGEPLEALNLERLANVTINDPIDRQTLAYDEASGEWINDGAGSISIPVFNNSNDDIVPGRPLSAVGAQGDRISVEPYQTAYGPLRFVGIAGETIPGRSNGHATVYGEIRGLDTSNFPVGTLLYPLEGVNATFYPFGLFTWIEGTNSSPLVCAIVTRQQQNTGRIFVRMWSPGYRNNLDRLDDVVISNPYQGALLRYDSTSSDWRTPPQTSKTILEGATETVEIYYYSITTDTQQFRTAQSDTPSAGNKIVRKIWYSTTAQADIDSGSWTLLETLADNATYADLVDAFEDQLKTSPGGDTPVSIKTTWEDVTAFTGLLDTYSGAAAAYSLRLLDSDYTGSAIRVRRASDNAEQDIGFDANGDLDTTALATFCSGTDGFVKIWYDQANSNDATQTVTGDQPKIYDSTNGVIEDGIAGNEKPAIYFDGSTHVKNSMSLVNQPITISHVVAIQSYGAVNYMFDSDPTNTNRVFIGTATTRNWRFFAGTTATSTTGAPLSQVVLTGVFDGSGSELFVDNTSILSASVGSNGLSDLFIGTKNDGTLGIIGNCQELIVYPSNQDTAGNRTGIETNINDYYNIYTP